MSAGQVKSLTDDTALPWFEEADDPPVFEQMAAKPNLGSGASWVEGHADSTRWDFSKSGPHHRFTQTAEAANSWRVTMTRHVAAYMMAPDRNGLWIADPRQLLALDKGLVQDELGNVRLDATHPVIVYRFPTNNDNSRTLIATMLPAEGWLYSKGYVHGISVPRGTKSSVLLALLGYLNSIPADWWARRFVDRHLGKRIIEGLPLPEWTETHIHQVAVNVSELLRRGNGPAYSPGGNVQLLSRPQSFANKTNWELFAEIDRLAIQGLGIANAGLSTMLRDFSSRPAAVPAEYRRLFHGESQQ